MVNPIFNLLPDVFIGAVLDGFAIYAFWNWRRRKARREQLGIPQNDDQRLEAAGLDVRLSRIDCKAWIYIILVVFNIFAIGLTVWDFISRIQN